MLLIVFTICQLHCTVDRLIISVYFRLQQYLLFSCFPFTDSNYHLLLITVFEHGSFERDRSWNTLYDEMIVNAEASMLPDFLQNILCGDLFLESLPVRFVAVCESVNICLSKEIITVFCGVETIKII